MMSWIVDNAFTLYVIFGLAAAVFLFIWYNNRQARYFGYAAASVVLISLVWLATYFFSSDRKQLEQNVRAMRDAVVARNADDLFKHISKDFSYKGMDRDVMYAAVKTLMGGLKITEIGITSFRADDISSAKGLAKTSFVVTAHPNKETFRTEADFVLEGDQWKLKTLRFFGPVGGPEVDVPGLR